MSYHPKAKIPHDSSFFSCPRGSPNSTRELNPSQMYLEHSFMQLPSLKIPNWTKQTRTSLFDEAQLSIKNSLKLARSQEFWVLLSTSFKRMEATEEQNSSATPKLILSKKIDGYLATRQRRLATKKLSLNLFIFAQTRLFQETKKPSTTKTYEFLQQRIFTTSKKLLFYNKLWRRPEIKLASAAMIRLWKFLL